MITVHEATEDLVQYFIEHWDDYVANIYRPNTIKITYKDIVKIFCEKYPMECRERRRGEIPGKAPWFYACLMMAFQKRGYKVEKVKISRNKTILYVHKA